LFHFFFQKKKAILWPHLACLIHQVIGEVNVKPRDKAIYTPGEKENHLWGFMKALKKVCLFLVIPSYLENSSNPTELFLFRMIHFLHKMEINPVPIYLTIFNWLPEPYKEFPVMANKQSLLFGFRYTWPSFIFTVSWWVCLPFDEVDKSFVTPWLNMTCFSVFSFHSTKR